MITAVIFDWGGVLIDHPGPNMIKIFSASLGIPQEAILPAADHFVKKLQKGEISEKTLWEEVCRKLNIQKSFSPSLWEDAFKNSYQPRDEMFLLASSLKKQGYKVGLLSNTEFSAMNFFKKQQYDMFDVTVFSCAEGVSKPEKKIYQITLQRLQARPEETVFIDDRQDFLVPAQELGIKTIHFQSPAQVKQELANLSVKI